MKGNWKGWALWMRFHKKLSNHFSKLSRLTVTIDLRCYIFIAKWKRRWQKSFFSLFTIFSVGSDRNQFDLSSPRNNLKAKRKKNRKDWKAIVWGCLIDGSLNFPSTFKSTISPLSSLSKAFAVTACWCYSSMENSWLTWTIKDLNSFEHFPLPIKGPFSNIFITEILMCRSEKTWQFFALLHSHRGANGTNVHKLTIKVSIMEISQM